MIFQTSSTTLNSQIIKTIKKNYQFDDNTIIVKNDFESIENIFSNYSIQKIHKKYIKFTMYVLMKYATLFECIENYRFYKFYQRYLKKLCIIETINVEIKLFFQFFKINNFFCRYNKKRQK